MVESLQERMLRARREALAKEEAEKQLSQAKTESLSRPKRERKPKEPVLELEQEQEISVEPIVFTDGQQFDEVDLEIIKLLLKKYHSQGTNIIRADQKNPFPNDFNRLGYLLGNVLGKNNFKLLHEKGFLKKTKFGGQFQINEEI